VNLKPGSLWEINDFGFWNLEFRILNAARDELGRVECGLLKPKRDDFACVLTRGHIIPLFPEHE
jgi:hypothetical protein